jgi:hypothetical protein
VSGRALVVLPTYNEAENLPPMLEQILQHGPDVLVVHDGSTNTPCSDAASSRQCRLATRAWPPRR